MLNIAVIGCGYWGTHLVRNFNNSDVWNLVALCDIDEIHLNKISKSYSGKKTYLESTPIFYDNSIDAVAIATPSSTHYELTKKALLNNKHVWVEKPFTMSLSEAEELVKLAQERNLKINVDHTYIYTSSIRKIKEIIDSGILGKIMYFDAVRINLGLFQHDVNVIWDLAPHDISIINFLLNKKPLRVSAVGKYFYNYNQKKLEEIAYLHIEYEDNIIAHINLNWMSPVKIRRIIIGATERMLIFDDMETVEKIKVFDTSIKLNSREEVYDSLIQYRIGDMYSPAIKNTEALAVEVQHFYDCIIKNKESDTNGISGLNTIKVMEAAQQSLKLGGTPIEII